MHLDEQCWEALCVAPLEGARAAHGCARWHGSGAGSGAVGNALCCGGFAMGWMLPGAEDALRPTDGGQKGHREDRGHGLGWGLTSITRT